MLFIGSPLTSGLAKGGPGGRGQLSLPQIRSLHAEIAISTRDSRFCAKSVTYNIFTNGAPYWGSDSPVIECPPLNWKVV